MNDLAILLINKPWILILVVLWTLPWKGAALWRAARRGHLGWFLTLLILNTLAILDILYLFVFSNWGNIQKQNNEQEEEEQEMRTRQVRYAIRNNKASIV